jgi:hypothetical protein
VLKCGARLLVVAFELIGVHDFAELWIAVVRDTSSKPKTFQVTVRRGEFEQLRSRLKQYGLTWDGVLRA